MITLFEFVYADATCALATPRGSIGEYLFRKQLCTFLAQLNRLIGFSSVAPGSAVNEQITVLKSMQ